jgi:hypothetical protein
MKDRSKRRGSLPYRILLVAIVGGALGLALTAFSDPQPQITSRAVLLLFTGVLLLIAIALEVVYRDVTKLRERVRMMERERER